MGKTYHTVLRVTYIKDGLLRERYIRVEDECYESADYYERYYSDHEDVVVINQFVTEEE